MNLQQIIRRYMNDIATQDAQNLKSYFLPDAIINWHNTNESFSVDEFIIANCEYPGDWCSDVERIEIIDDLVIAVTRIWHAINGDSFHCVSFFKFQDNKVSRLDEYWGDDGNIPQWRLDKKIGTPIKGENKND